MRSWQIWLATFALTTICIGLYLSKDRNTKENTAMYNRKQTWKWKRCQSCNWLWCTDRTYCPADDGLLVTVQTYHSTITPVLPCTRMEMDEFADVWRELEMDARRPFTAKQVACYIEMQQSYMGAEAIIAEHRRREFARYLIETGKLVPGQD